MNLFQFTKDNGIECHDRNLAGSLEEALKRNDDVFFYLDLIYKCEPSTRSLIAFLSRTIQRMPPDGSEVCCIIQKFGVDLDYFLRTGRWTESVKYSIGDDVTDIIRRGWVKSYLMLTWDYYNKAAHEEFLYLNEEIPRHAISYLYRDGINGPTKKEHARALERLMGEFRTWAMELLREEGVV